MLTTGNCRAKVSIGKGVQVFVVLNTHSDNQTGGLQWGGGPSKLKYSPVSLVVRWFYDEEFLAVMKACGTTLPSGAEME
jgi:hypothetical protein